MAARTGPRLTARQQRFVEQYLISLNATKAAIEAGYSAKMANQQGPRRLVNVGIAAAIQAGYAARSERTQIKADDVLRELCTFSQAAVQRARHEVGRR